MYLLIHSQRGEQSSQSINLNSSIHLDLRAWPWIWRRQLYATHRPIEVNTCCIINSISQRRYQDEVRTYYIMRPCSTRHHCSFGCIFGMYFWMYLACIFGMYFCNVFLECSTIQIFGCSEKYRLLFSLGGKKMRRLTPFLEGSIIFWPWMFGSSYLR